MEEPDYEALAKEAEAKLAAIRKKQAPSTPPRKAAPAIKRRPKDGDTLRSIQEDRTHKDRITIVDELSTRYGYGGHTLMHKLEALADKLRKKLEDIVVETGQTTENQQWVINRCRLEGVCASLGIMRSTNMKHELQRCNKRVIGKEDSGTIPA